MSAYAYEFKNWFLNSQPFSAPKHHGSNERLPWIVENFKWVQLQLYVINKKKQD